jgi:hypothetical protein
MKSQLPVSKSVKHCLDFSYVFSAPLHEETCFQQAGSSAVEGTSQAVLESSEQRMVPASLSLFLKSEKLREKDPSTGPSVIFDLFPQFTGLGHTSQITEGPYSGPSPIQNSIPILYMR